MQYPGRVQRSPAQLAHQQHLGIHIRQVAAGIGLQLGTVDGQRPFGLAGGTFVRLPDVNQDRAMLLALARLAGTEGRNIHAGDYRPVAATGRHAIQPARCARHRRHRPGITCRA